MEISIDFLAEKIWINRGCMSLYCPSNWVLHGNFHRQLVAKNFWNKFNPRNWALHINFHRHLVAKNIWNNFGPSNERYLKISIDSLGLRISETFVQTNGYHMEISKIILSENIWIYHGWVYIVQAIEYYMEISIDNLWQKISEKNLIIQGIGHYKEISIDSFCGKEYPKLFCQSDWHCKESISQTFLSITSYSYVTDVILWYSIMWYCRAVCHKRLETCTLSRYSQNTQRIPLIIWEWLSLLGKGLHYWNQNSTFKLNSVMLQR